MSEKYSLEGKLVSVFLEGNWSFSGWVEYVSEDKIVLTTEEGSLVVYKNKIVAAVIIDETIIEESIEQIQTPQYDSIVLPPTIPDAYINHNIQLDHYGSIIPEDMLEGEADPTPVSFSLSMSDLKNPAQKEKRYGSTKKDRVDREEDTK